MSTQLVQDFISHDLKEMAQQILQAVDEGRVVGAVFGLHLRGRRYIVNSAGTLARDPTLARGVVAALDDELSMMVQQTKRDRETPQR